jgi:hypothetical protein
MLLSMRRRVAIVMACLIVGVISTLAVQLFGVLRPGKITSDERARHTEETPLVWPEPMPEEYLSHPRDRFRSIRWGSSMESWGGADLGGRSFRGFAKVTAGWPARSAVARTYTRDPQTEYRSDGLVLDTSNWPGWAKGKLPQLVAVPIRPIWPGFVLNAGLYALLCALVLFGPGIVRRRFRRSKGRCVHCGYQLLPADIRCSECGNLRPTVAPRRARVGL